MSWLLRTRFKNYEILDHFDLRDREIARRPVPILDDRPPITTSSEAVEEPPPPRQPEPEIPIELPQLELTCEIEETPQIELTVEII